MGQASMTDLFFFFSFFLVVFILNFVKFPPYTNQEKFTISLFVLNSVFIVIQ